MIHDVVTCTTIGVEHFGTNIFCTRTEFLSPTLSELHSIWVIGVLAVYLGHGVVHRGAFEVYFKKQFGVRYDPC